MPAPHVTVGCHFCERPVHPRAVGTFELVTGWGEYRTDGGMNAVRLPELHRKFAHRTCIDLAKRGHRAGQTSLDEAAPAAEREALVEDALPLYDGTQSGMTAVACPHCEYCSMADRMDRHLREEHAE